MDITAHCLYTDVIPPRLDTPPEESRHSVNLKCIRMKHR